MKDWVLPFLLSRPDDRISLEEYEREISIPSFAYRRLASYFNINFSENTRLVEIFGGVVSDLPQGIFFQLLGTRNLFFSFNDGLAFVQQMSLSDFPRNSILCSFSSELLKLSDSCVRGTISHELCHICLGHYQLEIQAIRRAGAREDDADQMAISWGFSYEISAVREFLKTKSKI
jgi:hypothetical protein